MASLEINFKFPMTAIGKCEVNGIEYAAGVVFDAGSQTSRDFLVNQGAAVDYTAPTTTGKVDSKRITRGAKNG